MAHPYITELKLEHININRLLDKLRHAGIATPEREKALTKAKSALLEHLKKEDRELYSALREAAKKDRRLAEMLLRNGKDLEDVSQKALDFFNTYANGGTGYNFGKDFGALVSRLNARIRNEESELYSEYERLKSSHRIESPSPVRP